MSNNNSGDDMMEGIRDRWDSVMEDFSIIVGDAEMQKKIGLAISVLMDGLLFISLAGKKSLARPQLSFLDVLICGMSVFGTLLFIFPRRRYELENSVVLSMWEPNVIGRQIFCFCNPLAVLVILHCIPHLTNSLPTHVALATGITVLFTLIVRKYERLLAQRNALACSSYNSLESFLSPLAFKSSVNVSTQT